MPMVTSRVKSGVTARSVTRMGMRPHESCNLPSAFYKRIGPEMRLKGARNSYPVNDFAVEGT